MDWIYAGFKNFVNASDLIIPGDRILLSLSAGKDSMFMLHLVMRLKKEINFHAAVFHLNHLTRGDESDYDEELVRRTALEYGLICHAESFDFKKNRVKGISFEEHARNVRYGFLKNIAGREGYSKIATAHNKNDNAETVLMRILSGTGIAGLKGILPVSGNIIRPVLFADKNEIYDYLRINGIPWREDKSNMESGYLRNYTRNVILPLLKKRFHDTETNLHNLSCHAVENLSLLSDLADTLYPDVLVARDNRIVINLSEFHDNIPLIKFYISRVFTDNYGLKLRISVYNEIIRRYHTKSANKILYENESVTVRKGLINGKVVISFTPDGVFNEENVSWEYPFISGCSEITIEEIRKKVRMFCTDFDYYTKFRNSGNHVFLQYNSDASILIRNRRDGDRIKLESGTVKIKKLMIEKKLDSNTKKNIPLIMIENQVAAYLPGIVNQGNNRIGCNFRIGNNTKRIAVFFFTDY